jgi:Rrf2 family protein
LKSVQGIKGGYMMNQKLETVSLAEVIEAIEGPIGITDCRLDKEKCNRINICTLRDNFDPIQKQIVQQLNNIRLLDFMNA